MERISKAGGVLLVLGMLLLSGCGVLYAARPITGMVVDEESGDPLPGVIIVAQWKVDRHWVGDERALLKVLETTSTNNGSYPFQGWGPIVCRSWPTSVMEMTHWLSISNRGTGRSSCQIRWHYKRSSMEIFRGICGRWKDGFIASVGWA